MFQQVKLVRQDSVFRNQENVLKQDNMHKQIDLSIIQLSSRLQEFAEQIQTAQQNLDDRSKQTEECINRLD